MPFFLVVVGGLFGFIVGSFSNALIWRMHSGESIVKGRSHCVHCGHTLAWYDLIPMVSFVMLRGHCRYCAVPISLQYPLVEVLNAALLAFITWHALQFINPSTDFIFYIVYTVFLAIVFSGLLVILVYDLKHYLIPDNVLFPLTLVSGVWYGVGTIFFDFYTGPEMLNAAYAALIALSFFLVLFLVSAGRWMGFGDVKLAFFMGLFLGYPAILVALFFAFTSGAIIGVALIALKMKTIKSQVPFGPFLIAGTFVAFFWSNQIVSWYFGLLL